MPIHMLKDIRVEFYWTGVPWDARRDGLQAIFLPRSDDTAMLAAEQFRINAVFDLGLYLKELAACSTTLPGSALKQSKLSNL